MNLVRSFLLFVLPHLLWPLHAKAENPSADYQTIRFYTERSQPERITKATFSPDGKYLALSFSATSSSTTRIALIDVERQQLLWRAGRGSYVALAFTRDSKQLLGVGSAGFHLFDARSGSWKPVTNFPAPMGELGIRLREQNGKLLVEGVDPTRNPSLAGQVQVDDELLAFNQGAKPTLYNDKREWKPLVGKRLQQALELLTGRPGTWVQLRLARRGATPHVEVALQRQWPVNNQRALPDDPLRVASFLTGTEMMFVSADPLNAFAFLSPRDLNPSGRTAVSSDGKLFGAVAQVVNDKEFGVEVHSLESGKLEASALLKAYNYRCVRFSQDSKQLLVGTRDTVEVFDVATSVWLDPVVLTPPEAADYGRGVNRRIPLGFGFPGDLYLTTREVVYSRPAALAEFDVSPQGILAIGSQAGDLVLASLESKDRIGLLGEQILGGEPDLVEFSPTGGHLVAFTKGVLFIFTLTDEDDASQSNSKELEQETAK